MFAGQLRSFVVSIILARLLLPEDFGLLGMAMVFSGIAASFVDFGFGNAVIQKQRVSRVQLSTIFWINMLMALILGLIMFATAPLVASYFEMPKLKAITQIMSLTFLVKGLSTLQGALFKKKLDFKTPFKIEIVSGVMSGALGIYLAYTGFGVYSLIYSEILGWTIATILMWSFSTWKPAFLFNLNEVKELWNFGYKYSLSIFIDSFFNRLDTIVIGKIFSASTLGLFYKAQSLNKMVVQYAFNSFSGVLFPSLARLAQDKVKLKEVTIRILHIVCFTTFLFSGLMFINAESIIVILFTEKWMGSVPIFKILGLFSFIFTIPSVLNAPILSTGNSGAILKIEIVKKILYLLAIPLAIYYGLYAYIIGTIVAAILGMLLNLFIVENIIRYKMTEFFKLFLSYAIPFFIFMAIDFLIPSFEINHFIQLVSKSSLFLILYIAVNHILKLKGFLESKDLIFNSVKRKNNFK